jgi:hypothetical protein
MQGGGRIPASGGGEDGPARVRHGWRRLGHAATPGRDGRCAARRGDASAGDDTRRAPETAKRCGDRQCSGAQPASWRRRRAEREREALRMRARAREDG